MAARTFVVPGINCEHCKKALESGVGKLDGVQRVDVDVEGRTVVVEGDVEEAAVRAAIDEAGYEVESSA
jgi:copper ion binding protein